MAELFANRPEWADLVPIPQDENGYIPLAPILYSAEYKDAVDYFRAIVRKQEHSQRVLELTEHIIRLNPSHYSVWQYRYDTLLAIQADLLKELELMDEIATRFLKTYQVWHHRRLLLGHIRKPRPELLFIANALQEDTKNYHTWAYRQWILAEFNQEELWAGELSFVENMLTADVRNNSAWHHRYFVVWESGVRNDEVDRDAVLKRELSFIKEKISLAPNNASAWNYLRGVLKCTSTPFSTLEPFVVPYAKPRSSGPAEDPIEDLDNPGPSAKASLPCPQAIEFLADVLEEKSSQGDAKAIVDEAVKLYTSLAKEYDPMRFRYWEFRQREALKLIAPPSA